MRDQLPVPIDEFNGLFHRKEDDAYEIVPIGYASDVQNNQYEDSEIRSRHGFTKSVALPAQAGYPKRIFKYQILGAAARYLVLYIDAFGGNLYDTGAAVPSTPILSLATMVDFYSVTLSDRAYITPHNAVTGLQNEGLYVYNGTGLARRAAALKPVIGAFAAATSATAGNISAGIHLFAVAYETVSGFITKPTTGIAYTAPGGRKADLTGIPIGPTGTSKRHILATKLIVNYDSNPDNDIYEYFFVPGGIINENTSTTLTVNWIDSALISTADYLLDNLETIPAGCCLFIYQGSLVVVGEFDNPHLGRVSRSGDPESFSAIDGFIKFAPGDGGGVRCGLEFRSIMYVFKEHRTLATHSNGKEPSTWPVVVTDSGIGTASPFGIGEILDAQSNNRDLVLVADKAGLYQFNGSYAEKAISNNIEQRWRQGTPLPNGEVSIDPINFKAYVTFQQDPANTIYPDTLLVMDYGEGLAFDKVKWDPWTFVSNLGEVGVVVSNPMSILTDSDGLLAIFRQIHQNDIYNVYRLSSTLYYDDWNGGSIIAFFETANISGDQEGSVFNFIMIRLRISGTGDITLSYSVPDGVDTVFSNVPTFALSTAPGKLIDRLFNVVNEAVRVTFSLTSTESEPANYRLRRIIFFGKKIWASRPAV